MATVHKPKKKASTDGGKPGAPAGRYLRSFTLSSVRTFHSPVTLDFCREDGSIAQWTVILGENGTGKTTLLQYLAGMVPTDKMRTSVRDEPLEVYGPLLLNPLWHAWHFGNAVRREAVPNQIQAKLRVSKSVSCFVDAEAEEVDHSIQLQVGWNLRAEPPSAAPLGYWGGHASEIKKHLRLFGYGASRHVAGASSPYLTSDATEGASHETAATLYNDDLPLISPEQWFLGLDHFSRSDEPGARPASKALASAQRCFVSVLPDIDGLVVKSYAGFRKQPAMTLMCRTPYGEVPFSSLSVGYRTMAAWLTDFVKRMHEAFPDLDEPDDGPAVVLIDEFDLHMHPKWQREAMAALSKEFPNTQFIVTAHSPLIVQAAEGQAKLIVLRRLQHKDGTEEVVVDDHPRYAAGWRVDQILNSDLYGMDPRSATYEKLMNERVALRQKERLSAAEQKRLAEVEEQLDREAPPGIADASKQLFADLQKALREVQAKKP